MTGRALFVAGLVLGSGVTVLGAWRLLHRANERAAAYRAQTEQLLADLAAIPSTAVEHRARCAEWTRRQVERIDTYYLDHGRAAA